MSTISTWNVNSIRARLLHLSQWLEAKKPDLVALQETKCEDNIFPEVALKELGYYTLYSGQKSYNGVAFLAREPITRYPLNDFFLIAEQKRVIATIFQGYLVINIYVPNGQAVGSEKYAFKLLWLKELVQWIKDLKKTAAFEKIIILGDFNIAPTAIDHTSANFIKDAIMISEMERQFFQELCDLGFKDAFRLFCQEPKNYTWWDYRINAFERNLGYRIDHILVSDALTTHCLNCTIDRGPRALEKPSDHAPVTLEIQ